MAPAPPATWRLRTISLTSEDHTLIMGVVNVTPDSFSDGAMFSSESTAIDHGAAIAHGIMLYQQGADIIDVGGESTRPGSRPVSEEQEWVRVIPVVTGLAAAGIPVSIDTSKPRVAEAAIAAGAEAVNDIYALRDPEMAALCARAGVGAVLLHMQGTPETMQDDPQYEDVVDDVTDGLRLAAAAAVAAGVARDRVCIDPGIGFGKALDHNMSLLNGLGRIAQLGFPVLVGTSRKGFLGSILENAGHPADAGERDAATGATVALAIAHGASVVRVHNVVDALQSARTADAIVRSGQH